MIKMKIVVPVYNCQDWIKGCAESILIQQHKHFECVIINDASTDNTGNIIDDLRLDNRFSIVHNKVNQGALSNIVHGFKLLGSSSEPESVLMAIDGDDRLASSTSLSVVNKVYTKMSECLLTYGSYIDNPSGDVGICEEFPKDIIKNRLFRSYPKFITSHLRTFKSKLWHQLTDQDLIDPRTGKYYVAAWDLSFMMPMLEMAGDRFVYIPQILYSYNKLNPISDGYIRQKQQWETDQFIRTLPRKHEINLNQKENMKDPIELLTPYRFDVPLKYLYARSIIEGSKTSYFKEMYKEHLMLWNGFKEYNNINKNNFESFDDEFKNILNSISSAGFNPSISKVPVEDDKFILNGSHRLAACMALKKPIAVIDGKNFIDGQKDCSWINTFRPLGLSEKYANRVAVEYAALKKNTYVVTMFPSAKGNFKVVIDILNKHGRVVYFRGAKLEKNGPFNLMAEFYEGEPWAGSLLNGFPGYREKARLCFTTDNPTFFFLVEFNDIENSIAAKKEIRNIFQLGNHTIHINDTHEQTVRLSKVVFNYNSIHHLNNAKPVFYPKIENLLYQFKDQVKNSGADIDDYAITVSSVLSVYGLREARDVDYIHRNSIIIKNDFIESHNQYLSTLYGMTADELILNPSNYFHTRGIKFISLEMIKKIKQKRNEIKDISDIDLINCI